MSPTLTEPRGSGMILGLIRDLLEWQLLAGLLLLLPAAFLFLSEIWVPLHYTCLSMPPDDSQLQDWLRRQPGLSPWKVERDEGQLVVSFMIDHFSFVTPDPPPPLHEMGYDVALIDFQFSEVWESNLQVIRRKLRTPWVVIVTLLSFQLPMLWIVRRRFKRSEMPQPFRDGSWRRAAKQGLGVGLGLFLLIVVYRAALAWLGYGYNPAPWPLVESFPLWAQLTLLGLSLSVTPVAEESFIRGLVFGWPASAGRPILGLLLSVPVYAAMHFSLIGLPLLALMGWALAWLYRSSGHLAAPLSAHATALSLWMVTVILRGL